MNIPTVYTTYDELLGTIALGDSEVGFLKETRLETRLLGTVIFYACIIVLNV
jgi:hypothetical protein